jgi:hypothetical protein
MAMAGADAASTVVAAMSADADMLAADTAAAFQ